MARRGHEIASAGFDLSGGITTKNSGPQEAYSAILSHFVEHGRAPHYIELAERLGIEIEEARVLQREAAAAAPASTCWLSHDTDYVEAWGPFSNVPTHVRIAVGGQDKWFGL